MTTSDDKICVSLINCIMATCGNYRKAIVNNTQTVSNIPVTCVKISIQRLTAEDIGQLPPLHTNEIDIDIFYCNTVIKEMILSTTNQ